MRIDHYFLVLLLLVALFSLGNFLGAQRIISRLPSLSLVDDGRDRLNAPMPKSTSTDSGCLSQATFRDKISDASQAIIVMPAKAAGTALKEFAQKCNDASYNNLPDNFLKNARPKDILSNSFHPPGVVVSHLEGGARHLLSLIQNVNRKNLLIYSHREETSRILSAIAHVVRHRNCVHTNGDLLNGTCSITENQLIDIIDKKKNEIGIGASRILTCEVYEAIEDSAVNMIFMNYKHASQIQDLVAEKYCPRLVGSPTHTNTRTTKKGQIFVELGHSKSSVTLSDWLEAKSSMLEWVLGFHKGVKCKGKTKKMENRLFSCPGGILNYGPDE